jgi:multiple sugar transport system substrate-binding protein
LSLQLPNGVANDTFPWVWTAGGDVMQNGSPNVNNQGVVDALEFVKQMHDNNYLSPGTLTKKEQEKVEEFATGRVGMMISSIAHINILRNRNPDLNFGITAIPGPADYDGPPASRLVGWDAGIAANSDHKDAAWKLASYLVQQGPNGIIASNANAFPGNLTVTPDFVQGDELYSKAHDIFTSANLHAPLVGAPNATQLQRVFAEEMHAMLNGEQSASQAAQNAQERWEEIFSEN